jgi:hypothetical protein
MIGLASLLHQSKDELDCDKAPSAEGRVVVLYGESNAARIRGARVSKCHCSAKLGYSSGFAVIVPRFMRMTSKRRRAARLSAMFRRPRASNMALSASVATSAKNSSMFGADPAPGRKKVTAGVCPLLTAFQGRDGCCKCSDNL